MKSYGDPCGRCRTKLTRANARHRSNRPGLESYCRTCKKKVSRTGRAENREKNRRYRAKIRAEALAAYGGKCACCGESTPQFLALDHVHGGGTRLRKKIGNTSGAVYRMARDLGYPNAFRLLCHNCNSARGWYGACPHENKKVPSP